MSKYRFALFVAVSIVTGFVVGVIGASLFWLNFNGRFNMSNLSSRTQADIVTKVAVLERLRGDKYHEGVKMIETLLDGDLVTAGALVRNGYKLNSNAQRAIELECKARVVSGYEPADKTIRSSVQEAFRLFSADSGGISAQPVTPVDANNGLN
jgi:hypothetical protein